MDVHLRDLRYFVAVAEELHFTRAAERLYVSQPALSKQVRVLERQLGCTLFERRARTVALTAHGEALLPRARQLVADWDRALRAVRAAGPVVALTVGMQTAVGRDLQRVALRGFRERGWRISLRLVSWEDPTAGLADGSSDAAFLWLPVRNGGLRWRTLVREPRWVVLPVGHRLAAGAGEGGGPVDFAELLGEPFVALPRSAGPLRDFWLAADERGGREPVVAMEAAGPDEVFEAVAAGLGVALVAEGNARLYPRPDVVCRPVRGLRPAQLAIVWRADDPRPEVAEFVRAFPASPAPGGG
ncbi:MAG TPA: LysR substrate-binding domain-containing protein [Streptomyces sp.]|uniref:LysR family transcriptional regulator n=1 Tax=Streptomyces sp. TaxID=1931 RepID=UPI002D4ABB35|nr:LysR substrate-binding domain-containing protein [Streptomyces sp.]HZG06414.1 LysR substrate-binding domain-containing protein [Streptomyces sp.]